MIIATEAYGSGCKEKRFPKRFCSGSDETIIDELLEVEDATTTSMIEALEALLMVLVDDVFHCPCSLPGVLQIQPLMSHSRYSTPLLPTINPLFHGMFRL